jgi:hypothetical protein
VAKAIVKLVDHVIEDPTLDRTDAFKAGDIVSIVRDDYVPHVKIGPPLFAVVDIPGTMDDMQYLRNPQVDWLHRRVGGAALKNPELVLEMNDMAPRGVYRTRRYRIENGQVVDKERP